MSQTTPGVTLPHRSPDLAVSSISWFLYRDLKSYYPNNEPSSRHRLLCDWWFTEPPGLTMKRSFFHIATDADSVAELTRLTRHLDVLKRWPTVTKALARWKPGMALEKHIETVLLPAWQTLREAEAIEKGLSFYVIAWCVETLAWQRSLESKTLAELRDRMEASKRSREGLDTYQRLYNEFEEVYDHLVADTFREFGEDDMARLYENDWEDYSCRLQRGQKLCAGKKQSTG